MAKPKLTKKQRGFVTDYLATGNGTKAALAHYDVTKEHTAASIASENLRKPEIAETIKDALADERLTAKHDQLLEATVLERLNFDNRVTDEDIESVVSRLPGYELLHIIRDHKGDGSTYCYVKAPDNMTQDKALDKAYKIKGTYAPERSVSLNLNMEDEHKEKAIRAIRSLSRGGDTN
jgi:hypothetical protein